MHTGRRVLLPVASSKRKEREGPDLLKPSKLAIPNPPSRADKPTTSSSGADPARSNSLLAGYLAHEFLTSGTLFGQPFDRDRAAAVPVPSASAEPRRIKPSPATIDGHISKAEPDPDPEPSLKKRPMAEKQQKYAEVADLFRRDGAQLPGVVNPTQLARFLHLI